MRHVILLLVVLSASASWVESASAQEADAEGRALFEAGRSAYDAGRFEQALERFREAYELTERPELLYNIGQAADRGRHNDEARDAFERFLRAVPDSERRPYVERRLEALSEVEQTPVAPASSPSPAPWIVAGAGGLVLVTGVVLAGLGVAARDRVEDAEDGTPWSAVQGDLDRAPALIRSGEALAGVGLAIIAGGVSWGLLRRTDDTTRVAVGPNGVLVRGVF